MLMVPWSLGPMVRVMVRHLVMVMQFPCPVSTVPWPPPAVPGPICRDMVQVVAALVISDLLSSGCEHLGLSQ